MQTQGFEIRFSCAHLYHQKQWPEEQNRQVFGKCFSEHGHGHDYRLKMQFGTDVSRESVWSALKDLREMLDHRHLNFDFPDFKNRVPTSENLLLFCREQIEMKLGASIPMHLELWETDEIGASISSF